MDNKIIDFLSDLLEGPRSWLNWSARNGTTIRYLMTLVRGSN